MNTICHHIINHAREEASKSDTASDWTAERRLANQIVPVTERLSQVIGKVKVKVSKVKLETKISSVRLNSVYITCAHRTGLPREPVLYSQTKTWHMISWFLFLASGSSIMDCLYNCLQLLQNNVVLFIRIALFWLTLRAADCRSQNGAVPPKWNYAFWHLQSTVL